MDIAKHHDGGSHHQSLGNPGLMHQKGQETCISVIMMLLMMKKMVMTILIINEIANFNDSLFYTRYSSKCFTHTSLLTLQASPVKEVLLLFPFYITVKVPQTQEG